MAKNLTVRAQALGGVWETIGVERARGVYPENFSFNSDPWGATTCSFDLKRDSAVPWPDVSAFTPVEVEENGRVIWDGRVKETPARDGADGHVLNVQCEGWQYHLDDDMYERKYVHTNLGDWVDARQLPHQTLTGFTVIGKVTTGSGVVTLGWGNGDVVPNNAHVGVTLDLGASDYSRNAYNEFFVDRVNGGPSQTVVIRGHSVDASIPPAGLYEDIVVGSMGSITSTGQIIGGSFLTPWRYVTLLIYNSSGSTTTHTADCTLRVQTAHMFSDAGYTTLKAPVVIKDALAKSTSLLSADQTRIDPSSTVKFVIPSLAPDGPKTAREVWDGVNAYHGYNSKIAVGRVPVYKPQPSAPIVEVGDWSAMEFQDASSNSGELIYNRAFVTATAADSTPMALKASRQNTSDLLDQSSGVSMTNPSFLTNTAGWTASGGTLTRDTAVFQSTPASLRWTMPTAPLATLTAPIAGTFVKGTPYVVGFWMQNANNLQIQAALVDSTGTVLESFTTPGMPTFTEYRLLWTPLANTTSVSLRFLLGNVNPSFDVYIDTVYFASLTPTLVDRRGFVRTYQLSIAPALPADGVAMRQIADVWLDNHKVTPFRGSLTITGDRSIREISSGMYLPPSALLDMTGELIRLSDRVDPDTGGYGRDGVIASVGYDPVANTATVALDSARDNLQSLLNRLAVING